MKGLYLILDLVTLMCPIALSFDSKVRFVKSWKDVFIVSTVIAIPFLLWDAFFTEHGVWGFNPDYLIGFTVFGLPIEEILFFWVVPLACVFIYECCKFYFHKYEWYWLNLTVIVGVFCYVVYLSSQNPSGWYTLSVNITTLVVMYCWFLSKKLPQIGIAYLLCLLPFLIVNGVLTGSWIEAPIVWYNPEHFSGVRMGTIPMEDAMYGLSLIIGNIVLYECLLRFKDKKSHATLSAESIAA